jgi:hypothetical protein
MDDLENHRTKEKSIYLCKLAAILEYIYIYIYICKLAAILERLADKKGTLHYQIIGYYV